jgi:hypothetical protein
MLLYKNPTDENYSCLTDKAAMAQFLNEFATVI